MLGWLPEAVGRQARVAWQVRLMLYLFLRDEAWMQALVLSGARELRFEAFEKPRFWTFSPTVRLCNVYGFLLSAVRAWFYALRNAAPLPPPLESTQCFRRPVVQVCRCCPRRLAAGLWGIPCGHITKPGSAASGLHQEVFYLPQKPCLDQRVFFKRLLFCELAHCRLSVSAAHRPGARHPPRPDDL